MKKVYSIVEAQTNENGNIATCILRVFADPEKAEEYFVQLYRERTWSFYYLDYGDFLYAINDKKFMYYSEETSVTTIIRLIESEVEK